jgi:hypothetical protein
VSLRLARLELRDGRRGIAFSEKTLTTNGHRKNASARVCGGTTKKTYSTRTRTRATYSIYLVNSIS